MRSTKRAPISRSSPPSRVPSRKRRAGDVLAHLAAEEVADPLALAQPLGHPVEAGLQQADLAARRRSGPVTSSSPLATRSTASRTLVSGSAIAREAITVTSSPTSIATTAEEAVAPATVLGVDPGLQQRRRRRPRGRPSSGTPVPRLQANAAAASATLGPSGARPGGAPRARARSPAAAPVRRAGRRSRQVVSPPSQTVAGAGGDVAGRLVEADQDETGSPPPTQATPLHERLVGGQAEGRAGARRSLGSRPSSEPRRAPRQTRGR